MAVLCTEKLPATLDSPTVMTDQLRVLSIQSHVVMGYVGNKAATFPLQLLGFNVDAVNTVQFSNHTGYEFFTGRRMTDDELLQLTAGLDKNGLMNYTHLLTGYIGNAKVLAVIVSLVKRLRELNPNLVFVCDPVLGDHGKLYVPQDLVSIYARELLPSANIITPNQFEAEQLSGLFIRTEADALVCVDALLSIVTGIVVITSVELAPDSHPNEMLIFVGHHVDDGIQHTCFVVSKLECPFSGTGDLFSALVLARIHQHPHDVFGAVRSAIGTIQAVLKRTLIRWRALGGTMASRELALIESKADIESPVEVVREYKLANL